MYLVDTNVLSAASPLKIGAGGGLAAWMDRNSLGLFLSAITVAEIEAGIAKSRRLGAVRKADVLARWLELVLHLYGARVLAVDVAVARVLGVFTDQARAAGETPGLADLAIAATASRHGYAVLTRNVRHFVGAGVVALDPFVALPADCGL